MTERKWEAQVHIGNPNIGRVKGLEHRIMPLHEGGGLAFTADVARLIGAAPAGLTLAKAVAEHFQDTDAPLGQMARDFIAQAEGAS